MLFWIFAALLTLVACLAVLLPVARARRVMPADSAFDLAVYSDQLTELDRDVARGVVAPDEAEQARAEIGRRILRLGGVADTGRSTTSRIGAVIATVAVLAIPLASWGLYAATGSPHLPAQPLSARLSKNPADSSIDELVARAESHLRANPQDGRGWEVLAPIYQRMGRASEAVVAYRNAIRLLGADARREIGLGEALTAQGGGMIGTDAQAAFERALALEPGNPRARFLLAAAFAQEGRTAEAADALTELERGLAPDSPWRQPVAQALADLGHDGPGPSSDDVAAAGSLSANQRTEMIEQMVAGLDQRLREEPGELDDWQRLIRSYLVLGRRDAATDALDRGTDALGLDSEAAATLEAFGRANGLERTVQR